MIYSLASKVKCVRDAMTRFTGTVNPTFSRLKCLGRGRRLADLKFDIGTWCMMVTAVWACFFLSMVPALAAIMPDDHGNSPVTATAMSGGSNTLSGVINYDTDVDVFSFPFLPMRSYIIRVSTSTVWDVRLDVLPPPLTPTLLSTNTVWTNVPVSVTWTNPGAASRWYLAVSGMFQFTTGSYQIAVWESPFNQDSDGDGIADAWETNYFGNLSSANATSSFLGGGTLDLHSYLAGVNPTNGVAIHSWARASTNVVAGWPVAAYGTYDLYASTNVNGSWQWQGRHIAGGTGAWLSWTNHPGNDRMRFYKFHFVY